jgi:hypothetical protein
MPNAQKTVASKSNIIASYNRFLGRCRSGFSTHKAKQLKNKEEEELQP